MDIEDENDATGSPTADFAHRSYLATRRGCVVASLENQERTTIQILSPAGSPSNARPKSRAPDGLVVNFRQQTKSLVDPLQSVRETQIFCFVSGWPATRTYAESSPKFGFTTGMVRRLSPVGV